jgi:murein DD-endopeptidase MepM/ murein hydrolase activator NlpD
MSSKRFRIHHLILAVLLLSGVNAARSLSAAGTTYTVSGTITGLAVGVSGVWVDINNWVVSPVQLAINGTYKFSIPPQATAFGCPNACDNAGSYYITPVSSGRTGYVFAPSFATNVPSGQNSSGVNFVASPKPTGSRPPSQPDFALPFPGGTSVRVTTEAGGFFKSSNGTIGSDRFHTNPPGAGFYGVDLVGPDTGPILAAADGDVVSVACDGNKDATTCGKQGWGWNVVLRHINGYYTRYAHLSARPNIGGSIHGGCQVGTQGNTGNSFGSHLHFQLYYNGQTGTQSQSGTPELRGIQVQDSDVVGFTAGSVIQSTTPKCVTLNVTPASGGQQLTTKFVSTGKYFTPGSKIRRFIQVVQADGTFINRALPDATAQSDGTFSKTDSLSCSFYAGPTLWFALEAKLTGDLNGDGTVNSLDYSIMNGKWFTEDALPDLNADGIVNSLDFSILSANWGSSGTPDRFSPQLAIPITKASTCVR